MVYTTRSHDRAPGRRIRHFAGLVMAALVILGLCGVLRGSPEGPAASWSTFQHDAQRTGRTPAIVPNPPVRIWSLVIGTTPL